ncbi:hypothetical protein RUM43_000149 [Polyplax serrata]|uniref:Uncharacterized protein n=1 Tax=Polyplax serrata TaxID=468196 RepID=A0AAN8XNJ5_POLSC
MSRGFGLVWIRDTRGDCGDKIQEITVWAVQNNHNDSKRRRQQQQETVKLKPKTRFNGAKTPLEGVVAR